MTPLLSQWTYFWLPPTPITSTHPMSCDECSQAFFITLLLYYCQCNQKNKKWGTWYICTITVPVLLWYRSVCLCKLHNYCYCMYIWLCNWVVIWCRGNCNLLPGSPITAADLCGEHRKGRSRLLTAASTTAGPGVSVLIVTLFMVIYCVCMLKFCWYRCTQRGELKWEVYKHYFLHVKLQYAYNIHSYSCNYCNSGIPQNYCSFVCELWYEHWVIIGVQANRNFESRKG